MRNYFTISMVLFFLVAGCKTTTKEKDASFTFIERGDYVIDSYGDIVIYRNSETNKVMDGYYVVGNELSKWEEFNLKQGILQGDYLIFHSNGEIYTHSIYSNGKLNGEEKTYFPSGKLQKLTTYKNDEPYGKTTGYYESGQVESESTLKDGKVVESVYYDIIGTIVSQMFIREGRTIRQKIIGGKLHSEQITSNYDNFEAMKFFNADGSLKVYLQMLTDGDNGYLIELDKDGNELKRIDVKANPQEAMKYMEFLSQM